MAFLFYWKNNCPCLTVTLFANILSTSDSYFFALSDWKRNETLFHRPGLFPKARKCMGKVKINLKKKLNYT